MHQPKLIGFGISDNMDIFFIDDKGNNIGKMFDKKLLIEAAKIDA